MKLSRRCFLQHSLSALAAVKAVGQGVATHQTKAQARLTSGRPFNARFTDVASSAGLNLPIVYGEPQHKDYILETVGCGCAFFD